MLTEYAGKQDLLLWPFQVHSRLLREGCEHLLLWSSEGGDGAGRWRRGGSDKGPADLFSCSHPDEKLVIHDAETVTQSRQTISLDCFRYIRRGLTFPSFVPQTNFMAGTHWPKRWTSETSGETRDEIGNKFVRCVQLCCKAETVSSRRIGRDWILWLVVCSMTILIGSVLANHRCV